MLIAYLVAGAVGGFVLAASILVMGAALLWHVVFGENPWPPWAENGLILSSLAFGVAVFVASARVGWHRTARR